MRAIKLHTCMHVHMYRLSGCIRKVQNKELKVHGQMANTLVRVDLFIK